VSGPLATLNVEHGLPRPCVCAALSRQATRKALLSIHRIPLRHIAATLGASENAAIAQSNTHSTEVNRTRRRDLRIDALKAATSAQRHDRSSTHRVTRSVERSAPENGDLISIQRATSSDDVEMISIDKPTITAAELSIGDDMDIISVDEPTISAAELSIGDDMDIISVDQPTISDDMDIVSVDQPTISAAELSIGDDTDIISVNERTISDDMDIISVDQPTISVAELSIGDDTDIISVNERTINAAEPSISTAQGNTSLQCRVSF